MGGSKTSSHLIGYRVDLIPVNGKMDAFKKFIIDLKKRAFDNKKKLTLKKICSIIDVEVPSNLKKLQNKNVH